MLEIVKFNEKIVCGIEGIYFTKLTLHYQESKTDRATCEVVRHFRNINLWSNAILWKINVNHQHIYLIFFQISIFLYFSFTQGGVSKIFVVEIFEPSRKFLNMSNLFERNGDDKKFNTVVVYRERSLLMPPKKCYAFLYLLAAAAPLAPCKVK